jgi:agmatinase
MKPFSDCTLHNAISPSDFDLNGVGIRNGNFFGFPYSLEAAQVVFLPVPWDVTTSYGEGAADGPQTILNASIQLDWYDFDLPQAWQVGHGSVPINDEIRSQSQALRAIAKPILAHLAAGGDLKAAALASNLQTINQACSQLNHWVYSQTQSFLAKGKLIGVVGGDHSVPLGFMQALADKYASYGILQIDAHADLRPAFEGFQYSHASIMDNALQLPAVTHLVQVGVRDLCTAEIQRIQTDPRISLFDDWYLKTEAYQGVSWATQCDKIITTLPERVYLSFDIDGLSPQFCPHTGTPVPGGLEFNQAIYLIQRVVKSGKHIIGFDLCEVAPGPADEWDGNVGARVLYKLSNLMYLSQATRTAESPTSHSRLTLER